jgi:hypothetical protein
MTTFKFRKQPPHKSDLTIQVALPLCALKAFKYDPKAIEYVIAATHNFPMIINNLVITCTHNPIISLFFHIKW